MRFILLSIFTAALIAVPACSNAAPRSIDECEKIQAADAYNQCLAVFGPVARSHGALRDTGDTSNQDGGGTAAVADTKVAAAHDDDSGHGHVRRHGSMRHRWARHGSAAHGWARHGGTRHGGGAHGFAHHGHWHHSTASAHTHGKRTKVAFSTVSSRGRLR